MGKRASKFEVGTEALTWRSDPPPPWSDDAVCDQSSPFINFNFPSRRNRSFPPPVRSLARRNRERENGVDSNSRVEYMAQVIHRPSVLTTQPQTSSDVLDEETEKLLEDLVYVVCSLIPDTPRRSPSVDDGEKGRVNGQDDAGSQSVLPQTQPDNKGHQSNTLHRWSGVPSLLDMNIDEGAAPSSSSCWWVSTQNGLVAVTRQELLSEVQRTFKVSEETMKARFCRVTKRKAPCLAVRVEVPSASNLKLKSTLLGVAGVRCCVEGPKSFFVSDLVDAVPSPVWNLDCLIDITSVQDEELRIIVRQETDVSGAGKRLTTRFIRGIGKVAQTYTTAQSYTHSNYLAKNQMFLKEEEEEEEEDDVSLASFTTGSSSTLPTPALAHKVVKSRSQKSLAGSLLSIATAGKIPTGKDITKAGITSDVLGVVTLPLKELTELGTSDFFSLNKYVEDKAGKNKTEKDTKGKAKTKKTSKGDLKRRGEVDVRLRVTCSENQVTYTGGTFRGLQILLEKILRLHFSRHSSKGKNDSSRISNSDQDENQPQPSNQEPWLQPEVSQGGWCGDLPASLQALVTMFAYVSSAHPCDISLAWLCVCTRMPSWDASGTTWSTEGTTPTSDDASGEWIEKHFAALLNQSRSSVLCQSMMSVMNCSMTSLVDFPGKPKTPKSSEVPSRSAGQSSRLTLVEKDADTCKEDSLFLTMKSKPGTPEAHSSGATVSADSRTVLGSSKVSLGNSSETAMATNADSRRNSGHQSRLIYVDASFIGQLFQKIQNYLEDDLFTVQQLKELRSSTVAWRRRTRQQLCRMTSVFPSKAGVEAANQLASVLCIYVQLEVHPKTRLLLEDDLTLTEVITASAGDWWRGVTSCAPSTAGGPEAVLEEVLRVSQEALRFLNDAVLFYDPIFSENLGPNYSEGVFKEVVGKVMENVSSFLMTLDLRKPSASPRTGNSTSRRRQRKKRRNPLRRRGRCVDEPEEEEKVEDGNKCQFSSNSRSPAWQLYTTLSQIYSLGETMNTLDVRETPISGYHALFVPWQEEWLRSLGLHLSELLPYEVTRDTFENVTPDEAISASASDMEHNLLLLKNCWCRLNLPEGAPRARLLLKVLKEMIELASLYGDLVCRTLDVWVTKNKNGHVQLTKEVCTGLNNIAYTRKSLSSHMQYIIGTNNIDDRVPNLDSAPAPSVGAENTNFSEEVQITEERVALRLTEGTSIFTNLNPSPKSCQASSSDDMLNTSRTSSSSLSYASNRARQLALVVAQADARMRKKEEKYINAMVNKLRGNLREAVTQSCLQSSGAPLQQELGPVKNLLVEELRDDEHYVLVKRRLWKILLDFFSSAIKNSSKRGQPEFYRAMHDVVQQFLPGDNENGDISTNDMTSIPEYQSLIQELKARQGSTSSIIASYYRQRASDRLRVVEAVLDVRMGLITSHRLQLQVAMLSSLRHFSAQTRHESLPHTPRSSSSFPKVCIKIQLVPNVFLRDSRSVRTRNLSWDKFVVIDESFSIQGTPNGLDQGLVLFSLIVSYRRGSSVVVAEGVVPLDLVLIFEESSTLPNYRIKLTQPGPINDYESLRILQQRKDDLLARRFLNTQLQLRKKPSSFNFCQFLSCCIIM